MDTGSRPIMTYGEPAFTGGSRAPKEFPSARQIVRAVLSVHDRSEPPSGPILGEPAQTGSPRPRSLPRRAHHLASTYKFSHSNTAVTVTFSESVQASSITSSTIVLKDPSNNTVTATVSYNDTTHAAPLQPSSPLANSTTLHRHHQRRHGRRRQQQHDDRPVLLVLHHHRRPTRGQQEVLRGLAGFIGL